MLDRSFEQSTSFISAHLPSLGAYPHQPQPGTCEERSDKKGFRYFMLGFATQMRPERNPVCSLFGENALTRLVSLLSGCCRHDVGDECFRHLESVGEMLCNLRRNPTSR